MEYKRESPARSHGEWEIRKMVNIRKCLLTVTVHVIIHIHVRLTFANGRTLSKEEGPEMSMGSC